jgi:pimeloyl-ACP methyl ester carboxylesterase
MESEAITLSDGRSLGYQCLGDREGIPLFFFHGTPGSRFVLSQEDSIAQIPGLFIVLAERPGYGISDPKPDRTLLDWPNDIAQLADRLGVDSFAVAGASGGGPHALACSYMLDQRVTSVFLLASPSPAGFEGATRGMSLGNRLGLLLGQYAPWLVRSMMRSYASAVTKNPDHFIDAMAKQMAPADRELLQEPAIRSAIVRDLKEAYRQGASGQVVDSALAMTGRDWGFSLREVTVPVLLWHGEDDTLVSPNMARFLAAELPSCIARFLPGAGHLLTEIPEVVEGVKRSLVARAV